MKEGGSLSPSDLRNNDSRVRSRGRGGGGGSLEQTHYSMREIDAHVRDIVVLASNKKVTQPVYYNNRIKISS